MKKFADLTYREMKEDQERWRLIRSSIWTVVALVAWFLMIYKAFH